MVAFSQINNDLLVKLTFSYLWPNSDRCFSIHLLLLYKLKRFEDENQKRLKMLGYIYILNLPIWLQFFFDFWYAAEAADHLLLQLQDHHSQPLVLSRNFSTSGRVLCQLAFNLPFPSLFTTEHTLFRCERCNTTSLLSRIQR